MESWEDAEAAVVFLKQSQAGRATFLPLDSLRPGGREGAQGRGRAGLGEQSVSCDPAIRPAVELALNHVVVVRDLPTARRLLRGDSRATLVTVEGEIVRSGGSVTGGSDSKARGSGLLSRAVRCASCRRRSRPQRSRSRNTMRESPRRGGESDCRRGAKALRVAAMS